MAPPPTHNIDTQDEQRQQEAEAAEAEEEVVPIPRKGDPAPTLGETVHFPSDKPVIVVFLRHCGCPFAEKTFRLLTSVSNRYQGTVRCVAVAQAERGETEGWIVQAGGEWEVEVVVDPHRELYHAWGLGLSSTWYAVNPLTLWHAWKLGTEEGIWNRNTETGSRWQIGGAFAVDADGVVRWSKPAQSADEVPDFKEALKALGVVE